MNGETEIAPEAAAFASPVYDETAGLCASR